MAKKPKDYVVIYEKETDGDIVTTLMNSADIPVESCYKRKTCLRYGDLIYEIVD